MLPTVFSFRASPWESTRRREGTTSYGSTSLRRVPSLSDVESSAASVTPGCSLSSSSSLLRPISPGTLSWDPESLDALLKGLLFHELHKGVSHPLFFALL